MVHDVAELCVGAGTIVGECVDGIFFFFFERRNLDFLSWLLVIVLPAASCIVPGLGVMDLHEGGREGRKDYRWCWSLCCISRTDLLLYIVSCFVNWWVKSDLEFAVRVFKVEVLLSVSGTLWVSVDGCYQWGSRLQTAAYPWVLIFRNMCSYRLLILVV